MIESIAQALRATSPAEVLAVGLGFAYSILAARRNRLCWIAGGTSSAIVMYHFAQNALPMQAALNAYYVAMAVYGFRHWSRERGEACRRVATWPLQAHLLAWAGIAALSGLSTQWLAAGSAWPWLDSAVAWASVLATWLMARVKLENWLYWIATDAVLIFLSIAQDLPAFAVLYFGYLCIAVFGFLTWLKALRMHPAPA